MLMLATGCLMSAWVGQIEVPAHAHVLINPEQTIAEIDPRFYGFFTEHIFDALDWKLAAQKIKGRGFESGDADGDGVGDGWRTVGDVEAALDTSTSYPRFEDGSSSTSQRLTVHGSGGIAQGSLALSAHDAVDLTLYIRAEAGVRSLRVSLGPPDGPSLAQAVVDDLPPEWAKRGVRLEVDDDVFPTELQLVFEGEGTVWVDQISMLPVSAVHGWRRDVVDLYERIRPSTLRYPGGNFCQTYHFPVGLGDPDLRPVVPNPAWSNYPEPNNIGTDEFLRLCEHVGMEPILCLNIGDTGGAQTLPGNSSERALRESLDWLEYANGPESSEWGARRAANGHPAPYGVKLWEVGNEIGYGHIHGRLTAEQYAPRFREFAEALLEQDPSIELIACGHDPAWNQHLIEQAGDLTDFIAIHIYDNVPAPEDAAAHPYRSVGEWLDSHIAALEAGGATPETVRLALNEWSYSWSYWTGPERAVAAAGLLHECLKRAEWIAMTNTSDTVARFRNNEAVVFPDPECLAIALLADMTGTEVVGCDVSSTATETAQRGVVPAVDAVATREGDRLHVSLLNRAFAPAEVTVRLPLTEASVSRAQGILCAEPHAHVSFEQPEAIAIRDLQDVSLVSGADGTAISLTLDPMSVAAIEVAMGNAAEASGMGDLPAPEPLVSLRSLADADAMGWGAWEPMTIEGPAGAAEIRQGRAWVSSPADCRFGFMSPALDLGADEALVVETTASEFTGMNALLHLCAEGAEESMSEMLEVGIEHGRAQVWAGSYSWRGEPVLAPAAIRVVIGPEGPGGRVVEVFVDGYPCQRIPGVRWFDDSRPRVFLYGWGEGLRVWDTVRVSRVPVARELVWEEPFDSALDSTRWTSAAVVGEEGSLSVDNGALAIQGAEESRFGLLSAPIEQGPDETIIVTGELLEYEGTNGLMTLLAGGVGEFEDYAEVGVEHGRAQAWMRDWSTAGERLSAPAQLALVAGPPNATGQRRMSAYVNGRLVAYAPYLYNIERPLRLFLYGWGESRTRWGSIRVERLDLSNLEGHMFAPTAGAG